MITYTTADLRRSFDLINHQTLLLPGHPVKQLISLSQVIYIAGCSNYVIFHLANGTQLVVAYTLSSYESLPGFLRIHKRHAVNRSYVASIKAKGRAEAWICLTNGVRLPISRRRVGSVIAELSSTPSAIA